MRKSGLIFLIMVIFLTSCNQDTLPAFLWPPTVTPTPTITFSPTHTYTPTLTTTMTATFTPSVTFTPTAMPIEVAKLGTVEKNVTFCTMNGVPSLMDIYYPKTANGQWPVVMIVHGGAWIWGDKSKSASLAIQPGLTESGFLVVSINYRLAPSFPWPSMIEDAKCAVRFLRAHAEEYNLDSERIGAAGDSVGGQIVLLLGLTDPSTGWDVGEYLEYSSQVQAVVDFFGPTDLTDPSLFDLISKRGQRAFWNISWNSPELIKASPITYVKKDAPPIFIAHGNLDLSVRLIQSQLFYDKMVALGAPIWLVVMKNGIHSFAPVYYDVSPSYDEVYRMAENFFVNKLASLPCLCGSQSTVQPTDEPGSACFLKC
jgi:acetyl esterase/lipase